MVFVIWHVDIQSKHFLKEKKSMTLQNIMRKTIICPYPNPSPFIKKKHIVFLAYTSLTVHLKFADVTLSERRVTLWVGYTGQSLIVVYDILASNVKARRYGIDCKIISDLYTLLSFFQIEFSFLMICNAWRRINKINDLTKS